MPAKKTISKKLPTKKTAVAKKATKTTKTAKSSASSKSITLPPTKTRSKSLYIDSSFFFPYNDSGYVDYLQEGRVAKGGAALIAPIMLPVGSVMKTVTIFYKNKSKEDLSVWILKYHIDHHAYSGEVEVTYEACPPGSNPPDDFLQKVINHFDANGKILDKYLYHIEIGSTIKTTKEERMLRGIRIVYTEPA